METYKSSQNEKRVPFALNTLSLTQDFVARCVHKGDLCIDATAGRGGDTAFLCKLVGSTGRVIAFDIQPQAVESTRERLEKESLAEIAQVYLESHIHMGQYAKPNSVNAIMFNFGWLPGGDHNVFTSGQSSVQAIETGLQLLKPGGIMTLCIYYGKETGFAERDALLEYVQTIDNKQYTVLVHNFANRVNCPPIPVFIIKDLI